MKEKLIRSITVAALISGTLFLVGVALFYSNIQDFSFTLSVLFPKIFVGSVVVFLSLFLIQAAFFKSRFFAVVSYLFFCIGILLYFQSNIFLWNLGPLLNGEFWWDWSQHGLVTVLETLGSLLVIALLVWQRKFFYRNVIKIAFIVIMVQIVPLIFNSIENYGNDISYKRYTIDESKKFEFGKTNVILLVLDCYTDALLEKVLEEKPTYRESLRDFTRYAKVYCEEPFTKGAMFATLTGTSKEKIEYPFSSPYFPSQVKLTYEKEQNSLFHQLKRQGFQNEIYNTSNDSKSAIYFDSEYLDNIRPLDLHAGSCQKEINKFLYSFVMRLSPLRIKGLMARKAVNLENYFFGKSTPEADPSTPSLIGDLQSNIVFYQQMNQETHLGTVDKVFKYYHLNGLHELSDTVAEPQETPPTAGVGAYIAQAKGCMKLVDEFLAHLKKLGVYDNSLLIVMGDHGRYDEFYGLSNLPATYSPMLLIKQPKENHEKMVLCDNLILQADILSLPSFKDRNAPYFVLGSNFDPAQKAIREKTAQASSFMSHYWKPVCCQFKEQKDSPSSFTPISPIPWHRCDVQKNATFNMIFYYNDSFTNQNVPLHLIDRKTDKHYLCQANVCMDDKKISENEKRLQAGKESNASTIVLAHSPMVLDCSQVADGDYDLIAEIETTHGKVFLHDEKIYLRMKNGILSIVDIPEEERLSKARETTP